MRRAQLIPLRTYLLAIALFAGGCHAAHAQKFGTNRVDGIELRAEGAVILSEPTFMSPANICKLVREHQPDLLKLAFDALAGVSSKLPKDITLVRQKIDFSPACAGEVSYASGQLSLNVKMPRNIYFTNITTPGPLGQGADPRVSVDFDANASAQITLPSTAKDGLKIGGARARVFNIKLDGQNFTGDVAVGIAKLVDEIGGFGFANKLAQGLDLFKFDGMQIPLGKLQSALGQRGADVRVQETYDSARKVVVLNLVSAVTASTGSWSAYASNDKGRWGFAVHKTQDATARGLALGGCGGPGVGCKVFWTTQDKCVAYAESRKGGYWYAAAGSSANVSEATARAIKICQSGTAPANSCRITQSACAGVCPSGLKGPNCDVLDVR